MNDPKYVLSFKEDYELKISPWVTSNVFYKSDSYKVTSNVKFALTKTDRDLPVILIPEYEQAKAKNKQKEPISVTYYTNSQFRNRVINSTKIADLLLNISGLGLYTIGATKYVIGKGYIGTLQNGRLVTLLMITCEINDNDNPVKNDAACKIFINKELQKLKTLYGAINQQILPNFKGDIILTSSVNKYFGNKIKLPKFATIGQQEAFLRKVFADTLDSL